MSKIANICLPLLPVGLTAYTPRMQKRFMARAIELATENVRSGKGGPFGAVIVKDDEIVAEGVNSVTSMNDPTAHAEILAIRKACAKLNAFQLTGFELYTSCEPCPMCLGAIYWSKLDRVYFAGTAADASRAGFDDSFIYREIPKPVSDRKVAMLQIMREEAQAPFIAWLNQPNKIAY